MYKSVDQLFKDLIVKILVEGYTYADPNRKNVNRIEINHFSCKLDVSEVFPILSLRKLPYKNGFSELMVFMSGSNDIRDLWANGVNFWDKDWSNFLNKGLKVPHEWEQFGKILKEDWKHGIDKKDNPAFSLGQIYPKLMRDFHGVDQLQNAVNTLILNKNATKQTITMWDPSQADNQALTPCHFMFEFLPRKGSNILDLKWHQHSVDTFLGLPTNIVYYAGMLHFICNLVGMKPGCIIPDLSNVHLYDNAISEAKELISRTPKEGNQPKLVWEDLEGFRQGTEVFLDGRLKDIKGWTIEGYDPHAPIKVEMLAYSK